MHHAGHALLATVHPLVRQSFFHVAARHGLTVEALVQRTLGRELPGAPEAHVRGVDQAVCGFGLELLSQATLGGGDGSLRPPTKPAEDAAVEEQAAYQQACTAFAQAVERVWTEARDVLASGWPAPQDCAPPAPPKLELETEVANDDAVEVPPAA